MVRLRAKREMTYMTRMLKPGDSFEATPIDARFLLGDESAEEAEEAPRRGRPLKEREPEPWPEQPAVTDEPMADEKELEDCTVAELRALVEQRGIDLPTHYLRKDELIEMLQGGGGGS